MVHIKTHNLEPSLHPLHDRAGPGTARLRRLLGRRRQGRRQARCGSAGSAGCAAHGGEAEGHGSDGGAPRALGHVAGWEGGAKLEDCFTNSSFPFVFNI